VDHLVKIVVLDLEQLKTLLDLHLLVFGQRKVRHAVTKFHSSLESYPYTRSRERPEKLQG
jgi:hypothetical protein